MIKLGGLWIESRMKVEQFEEVTTRSVDGKVESRRKKTTRIYRLSLDDLLIAVRDGLKLKDGRFISCEVNGTEFGDAADDEITFMFNWETTDE